MSEVEIRREPDKDALATASGRALIEAIEQAQQDHDIAELALTGGSMGSAIIAAALAAPDRDRVDWTRVQIWWGDERYLPAGDAERNDTQNDAAGLSDLGIPTARIHRVAGPDQTDSAEAAASAYGQELRQFGTGEFDVVMLGMGPDGHVASLFPEHPAQHIEGELAVPVHDSPKPPPDRVSLTFEALNRARQVWFLVAGAEKAEAAAAANAPGADRWEVPAAGVHGTDLTIWWVDEAAAARLPE